MTAMTPETAARVEANLGLLADRIEEEALRGHRFPSGEVAEAIGQGNAVRRLAVLGPASDLLLHSEVSAAIRSLPVTEA